MADTLEPGAGSRSTMRWAFATAGGHTLGAVFWALPAGWLAGSPGEVAGPAPAIVMFGLTLIAAVAQGALLGVAQGLVLRDVVDVRVSKWAMATAAGVTAGWVAIILGAPTVGRLADSVVLLLALTAGGGLVFGGLVGGAQWWVLSRDGTNHAAWVGLNAVAWSIALTLTVAVMRIVGREWTDIVLGSALAALASGVVLALATGAYVSRRLG